MPRRIMPVSAFGSEIMSALLKAAKSELRIPFPSLDMAMRFRQRIYQLRTAMREEKHRDYAIAMSVRIYVEPEREDLGPLTKLGPRTVIRLSPADSEFASILSAAQASEASGAASKSAAEPTGRFWDLLREIEDESIEGSKDGS